MRHISYSELKDWVFCAFYHKLTRIEKIQGFKGNAPCPDFPTMGLQKTICEKFRGPAENHSPEDAEANEEHTLWKQKPERGHKKIPSRQRKVHVEKVHEED